MSDPVSPVPFSTLQGKIAEARVLSFEGMDGAVLLCLDPVVEGFQSTDTGSANPGSASSGAKGNDPGSLLRAQALGLRTLSLARLTRFAEALQAYHDIPTGTGSSDDAQARATMLADMAYLCIALEMPQDGLRLADAAFRLALANRWPVIESNALAWVSFCQANQGHLEDAERFLLEGLGIALQSGDDATIHTRLSNLLLLSHLIHDAAQSRGDADAAGLVMKRCARLVSQGERLAPRVGVHERCVWRAHRAGWLRRRGRLEQARADYEAVLEEAHRHGWALLARTSQLELAQVMQDEGQPEAAIQTLDQLLAAGPSEDSYHTGLRAHRRLEKLLIGQNRLADAQQHHAAYLKLLDIRTASRATAASALPRWSSSVLEALVEADRVRVDAEAERVRSELAEASNAKFLSTDWAPIPP